jgi:hypothetical protein
MKNLLIILFGISLIACSTKNKYEISTYYDAHQKDALLTSIISYIFIAPPYTSMEDRFKPEHREFYHSATSKFSFQKLYVADDGTHYFFLLRPAPRDDEKRGVGGYFKCDKDFRLTGFREAFVTPILKQKEAEERGAFLFDKMVKEDLDKYLPMQTYVEWPNPRTYYDTVAYEWKLIKEMHQ